MTVRPGARQAAAVAGGTLLLVLAGWLAYYTVHALDGPWGRPGVRGTLTVTKCVTNHGGGGDAPTMTCTGTFTAGRTTTAGVHLDMDLVSWWAPGETFQVRLPDGSHTAYRPGGQTWLIYLGFFLFLVGAAVVTFGSALGSRWGPRVQAGGGIVIASAFLAPPLVLLISWAA
jgi:hypothetical protein